jgi:hypothetical protein
LKPTISISGSRKCPGPCANQSACAVVVDAKRIGDAVGELHAVHLGRRKAQNDRPTRRIVEDASAGGVKIPRTVVVDFDEIPIPRGELVGIVLVAGIHADLRRAAVTR